MAAVSEKLVDAAFLTGVACATYKLSQTLISLVKGFRTYFVPFGRAVNCNLTKRFGEWAGEVNKKIIISSRTNTYVLYYSYYWRHITNWFSVCS